MTKPTPDPNDSLEPDPLDASRLDRALDGGFAAARQEDKADRNPSVLKQIGARLGSKPSVSLRDVDPSGETPMLEPLVGKQGRQADTGRYKVLGILGQGGVGAVHRGHDTDLGRDVAMKFLHERYAKEPSVLHRFVEEAQIGGQLQHPGIVPVYELGLADGKPFFTMKMVKGETLAKKLSERPDIGVDRRKFLVIFEDVCQTMAYAHARGVVHRDLKPANIMIGAFGEVQIVDWGMGKVLSVGGGADEQRELSRQASLSVIETPRSSGHGTQSVVGTVMGTPAYMPPEQARGDVEAMDEGSDVFALGAILCEILTGMPPYVGDSGDLISMAAMAKLDDAYARLAACGAEADLVELATLCLMPAPAARPRSAGEVAKKIQTHLGAAEERAHEATIRAISLKRMQKLGVALILVTAAGLAVSLWFGGQAADARGVEEQQREQAVVSREEAEDSRQAAQDSSSKARERAVAAEEAKTTAEDARWRFDQLAFARKLISAKASLPELWPAWPGNLVAMKDWLAADVKDLLAAVPGLREAIDVLRTQALPQGKVELAASSQTHSRAAELQSSTSRLKALQAARAVRLGTAQVKSFALSSEPAELDEVLQMAKQLSGEGRDVRGREAEGMALAIRAMEIAERRRGIAEFRGVRLSVAVTLAWSLFANGLDDEALKQHEAALVAAGDARTFDAENSFSRLQYAIDVANSPVAVAAIDLLKKKVVRLQAEVAQRWHYTFEGKQKQFLHDSLRDLLAGIEAFDLHEVAQVRQELHWADQVQGLTVAKHSKKWQAAQLAIAAADGVTASDLYAADRFVLKPQRGLVPIGMNPGTKLWEFYHLRSAWDGRLDVDAIPIPLISDYREDGSLQVTGATGIVFVLLPGGTFTMGPPKDDAAKPNSDTASQRSVDVKPFFLARHEMTQGQWQRLSSGSDSARSPSFFSLDQIWNGHRVTRAHPVEMVSWTASNQLLKRTGLTMPSEEEWEYGCRAGTTTPWSCAREDRRHYANFCDASAMRSKQPWGRFELWDDGHVTTASVGSFRPNGFGLHDMHGNVWELTQSEGVNLQRIAAMKIMRGGSFKELAEAGTSAARKSIQDTQVGFAFGMRPARALARNE